MVNLTFCYLGILDGWVLAEKFQDCVNVHTIARKTFAVDGAILDLQGPLGSVIWQRLLLGSANLSCFFANFHEARCGLLQGFNDNLSTLGQLGEASKLEHGVQRNPAIINKNLLFEETIFGQVVVSKVILNFNI